MFNHTERNLNERQYMFFAATTSLSLNTLPGHSITFNYVFPFYYSINLHCVYYSTIGILSGLFNITRFISVITRIDKDLVRRWQHRSGSRRACR